MAITSDLSWSDQRPGASNPLHLPHGATWQSLGPFFGAFPVHKQRDALEGKQQGPNQCWSGLLAPWGRGLAFNQRHREDLPSAVEPRAALQCHAAWCTRCACCLHLWLTNQTFCSECVSCAWIHGIYLECVSCAWVDPWDLPGLC